MYWNIISEEIFLIYKTIVKLYSPFFSLCQSLILFVLHFPLKNPLTMLTEPIVDL